ncbi:diacylglycerol kinase family lipid kinase [Mobilitalea sibirica]|uniref:Diacylglycerol kinase family lipid kinase n=1 Tax=Mobilitalea sibirica TaxID=1462919 RepID=A0A8J7H3J6_9FIRM|nr:diacylglycerol kinase family protein [Mobilitalea sibirica]MBH1941687.1 diacylglycerol kinase family lipid kinase [Mobilitalea sibirica]
MYHFIVNPKSSSGKGIRFWWAVKSELDHKNITYNAYFTRYVGHASEIAEQICNKTLEIKNIVVLGGDGTLNEVINGIPDFNDVLLGYIPSGSSNDLARSLGILKDPLKSLERILKPTNFKYLDLGIINFIDTDQAPRKFCCSSGIGYDANVCMEVQQSPLKKKLNRFGAGKFIYLAIAIKQLIGIKHLDGTVMVDGMKKDTYKNILLVSNMIHKYEGGGLLMAPNADPSDGKLSICLVHGLSRGKIALLLPTILFGKHIYFKGVEAFHCSEIEIKASQTSAVHTDGEVPAVCSHIKVSCIPGQIRMIL